MGGISATMLVMLVPIYGFEDTTLTKLCSIVQSCSTHHLILPLLMNQPPSPTKSYSPPTKMWQKCVTKSFIIPSWDPESSLWLTKISNLFHSIPPSDCSLSLSLTRNPRKVQPFEWHKPHWWPLHVDVKETTMRLRLKVLHNSWVPLLHSKLALWTFQTHGVIFVGRIFGRSRNTLYIFTGWIFFWKIWYVT